MLIDFSTDSLPIIVENLCKHAGMSIEKVLVQYRIVISERLSQSRQSCRWNFLQRGFVCLVSDAADVQNHTVLRVHVHIHIVLSDFSERLPKPQ